MRFQGEAVGGPLCGRLLESSHPTAEGIWESQEIAVYTWHEKVDGFSFWLYDQLESQRRNINAAGN